MKDDFLIQKGIQFFCFIFTDRKVRKVQEFSVLQVNHSVHGKAVVESGVRRNRQIGKLVQIIFVSDERFVLE